MGQCNVLLDSAHLLHSNIGHVSPADRHTLTVHCDLHGEDRTPSRACHSAVSVNAHMLKYWVSQSLSGASWELELEQRVA